MSAASLVAELEQLVGKAAASLKKLSLACHHPSTPQEAAARYVDVQPYDLNGTGPLSIVIGNPDGFRVCLRIEKGSLLPVDSRTLDSYGEIGARHKDAPAIREALQKAIADILTDAKD